MQLLEVKGLSFRYTDGAPLLLNNVDFALNRGEVVSIVGLSGIGKSTLCYCLSGIIPHVMNGIIEGEVLLEGQKISALTLPEIATRVGIVFQNPDTQLFSPTVEDEVAFGPENLCLERSEIERRISASLELVEMESFRFHHPEHLSGGQKQLVALASVLSMNPQILVFDEALSMLDKNSRQLVKRAIKTLKDSGKAVVMVEHDLANLDIADRILCLRNGKLETYEGKIC